MAATIEPLKSCYIQMNANALSNFIETLYGHIKKEMTEEYTDIVFVCIGTDRSTGDSLGPLVGYKLGNFNYEDVHVHGTLENPVHAKNLAETMQAIEERYEKPFIVAIDACLGKEDHINHLTVGLGPIRPGSAVNKDLPPVGHIHITGIVNFSGFMDLLILQNTRLCIVIKMAEVISNGIKFCMWKRNQDKTKVEVKPAIPEYVPGELVLKETKKRGRPRGSKDKKPRQKRTSLVEA